MAQSSLSGRRADDVIEVVCSDPAVHRRRLDDRDRAIDGFPEPTWDDVVARQAEWQDWQDRLVLDSIEPLADNVDRALAYAQAQSPLV